MSSILKVLEAHFPYFLWILGTLDLCLSVFIFIKQSEQRYFKKPNHLINFNAFWQ